MDVLEGGVLEGGVLGRGVLGRGVLGRGVLARGACFKRGREHSASKSEEVCQLDVPSRL